MKEPAANPDPEFHPWDPHDGRRPTPTSCPPTPGCVCVQTDTCMEMCEKKKQREVGGGSERGKQPLSPEPWAI